MNEAEKKSVYISKCSQAFGSNHLCHYHMHDKKLNLYHDLTQTDYFFYPDDTQDRFEVLYRLGKNIEDIVDEETNIQAFLQDSNFGVSSNQPLSKIELYDINGKLILSSIAEHNALTYNKKMLLTK